MTAAVLDLRREAAAKPLALPMVEIDHAARGRAIAAWERRMVTEHVSARVFAELVPQAMRAGLARSRVAELSAMIDQELEHGLLCGKVVAALGGEARAELPETLEDVPRHADAAPLEALLRNVIAVSCLHETVAVALVTQERDQVSEIGQLEKVLRAILADEVKHARFGWRLLGDVGPSLDDATRERLAAYLVPAFEQLRDHYAPFACLGEPSAAELAIGVPDGPAKWQLVVETIRGVIVPGLEAHGIAAGAAWRAANAA